VTVPPDATEQNFTGMFATNIDLSVDHIEVRQLLLADEDPLTHANVPLIAEKDTLVRVYVSVAGVSSVANVTAILYVQDDQGLIHEISQSSNGAPIIAESNPDSNNLSHTINFQPSTDLLKGAVTFSAEIDPLDQIDETNESNNLGGYLVKTFQPGQDIRIAWTMMQYGSLISPISPDIYVASEGINHLEEIYPVGVNDVTYVYQPGFGKVIRNKFECDKTITSCPAMNKYIKELNRFWDRTTRTGGWPGGIVPDRLYGWIPNAARISEGICGIADARWLPNIPIIFPHGKGRVAVGADFCDKPGDMTIRPDKVLAHEIGHLLNDQELAHTPNGSNEVDSNCFKASDGFNKNYPNYNNLPRGSIGVYGLDVAAYTLLMPDQTYDFMSYCQEAWVSPYNYDKLASGLTPASNAIYPTADEPLRQLLVSGTVLTPSLQVEFDPFYVVTSTVPADSNMGSEFCIEMQDNQSTVLDSRCFEMDFTDPEGYTSISEDSFALAVPYPIGTTQVVLTHLGLKIGQVTASDNSPEVELLSPNGGELWSGTGTYTVTWSASDIDLDPLFFTLDYSTDAGESWFPIGIDITETMSILDVSFLPGGSSILLRVSASDGINTSYDIADNLFTVGGKPPLVFITNPEPNTVLRPGAPVLLSGSAFDIEDGTIDGTNLTWHSSRDGFLGTGSRLLVSLSNGEHTITLTATDNQGTSTTTTTKVRVGYQIYLPIIFRN
jgi:hypothetical protein